MRSLPMMDFLDSCCLNYDQRVRQEIADRVIPNMWAEISDIGKIQEKILLQSVNLKLGISHHGATWLLFTGMPACFVVLLLQCPGPLG